MVKPVSGINGAIEFWIRKRKKFMDDSSGSHPPPPEVNEADLQAELQQLRIEHKDISDAVEALEAIGQADQLQIRRFKRRKLSLKDRIRQIEDQLTPDIIA
jgi:hypothetical protein